MTKIVFLCPGFFPSNGGVEKHVLQVSEKLDTAGYLVEIFRLSFTTAYRDRTLTVLNISGSRITRRLKLIVAEIKILYQNHNTEERVIYHFHDHVTVQYFPLLFIYNLIKNRNNVFITFHGWEGEFPPRKSIIWLKWCISRLVAGSICVGDFISKWYKIRPDKVTYGAVLPTETGKVTYHNTTKKRILFIGRLEIDSGIFIYLESLSYLPDKENYEFHVCGDGSLADEIVLRLKQSETQYFLHGFVDNIHDWIVGSDIVFTSGYLGILEAFHNRKYVISVYDHELKKDYLTMMPVEVNSLHICHSARAVAKKTKELAGLSNEVGFVFAESCSLNNLVDNYLNIWSRANDEK